MKIENYINGKLVPPHKGVYIDNIEPATGEVYGTIPSSGEKDVDMAVEAAEAAFVHWSTLPVEDRSACLQKIADYILQNLDSLAEAESKDTGKPLWLTKQLDIPRAATNLSFFASAIRQFSSEAHSMGDEVINYTLRHPIGIAGCISPWNLPLYLFTWKIAPALASGNCVIAKPSEVTPATAYLFSKICIEAGLPPGVLNIIHGKGNIAGDAIVRHPKIKAISFTGGTATGKHIASVAAPMFKKLSLELGGKNPTIIFDDANFEDSVKTTARAAYTNQGQICLCGSRIFVQKGVYEKFKQALIEEIQHYKVGDPLEGEKLGAIVSEDHAKKVLSYIELAKEEGGRVLTGGKRVMLEGRCKNGYYIEPTLIEGLPPDCRTNMEEIFGPVATLIAFDNEEEVIQMANCTEYGLAASVFTQNVNRAHRVACKLQSGIVWINCWLVRDLRTPFGGMKNSGVGREGGLEALRFFTESKNVCLKIGH